MSSNAFPSYEFELDGEPDPKINGKGDAKYMTVTDPRQKTVENVRKLLTAIEFELMNDQPLKNELRRHAQSAITLLTLEFCERSI